MLAPRVNYNYYVEDLDFGINALGTFLNLTGRFQEQVNGGGGGTGTLTANSSLTIVTAIVTRSSTRVNPSSRLIRSPVL